MEALSPRDVNAQLRAKQPPQKSKLAPAPPPPPAPAAPLKRSKNHAPPPPEDVYEPPSTNRPDGARYRTGKMLGKGGFAICHEGKLTMTKEVFALKIVKSHFEIKKMETKFQTELQIHSKMRHPNIVEFMRAFSYQESTYIVLELCPNGSLMEMTKKRKHLTEPEVRYYTVQIAGGIKYMHAKGIIHRDLKMGNIFLDKNMNVKIGDFGLAALLMSGKDMTAIRRTTLCGTPNYIAPEILDRGNQGHDHMVDIWSLGIIVFAMLTGQPPFTSAKQEEIYRKAKELDYAWPQRDYFDDTISREVKDLVSALLQEAEDRPDPDTIVQHPFFTSGWFPASDELSPIFRETSPKFPSITTRGSRANKQYRNLEDACIQSEVGPYPPTRARKLILTWKECAAEEKAGLTPVIPLPEGIVYLPFQVWQRENSDISSFERSPELKKPQPIKTGGLIPKPLTIVKAAPQSFAAQQRAMNRPATGANTNVASSAATKITNRGRPVREESSQRSRQPSGTTSASISREPSANSNIPSSAAHKISNGAQSVREESNQRSRQTGGATSASASSQRPRQTSGTTSASTSSEPGRGLAALPVRKSSARVQNAQNQNGETAKPETQIPARAVADKESVTSGLNRTHSLQQLGAPISAQPENQISHFSSSELVELVTNTNPDLIFKNVRSFHAELLRALQSKAPIAHQGSPPSKLSVVVKWVDYSGKFGLGYILSNGSIGCIFKSLKASFTQDTTPQTTPPSCIIVRDAEKHMLNRLLGSYENRDEVFPMPGRDIEFYEKWGDGVCGIKVNSRRLKVTEPGVLPIGNDRFERRRREKLMLWKKFAEYMVYNGREKDDAPDTEMGSSSAKVEEEDDAGSIMVLYQRFGDVGCWLFADGHFQFNFPDHTKLVISGDGTWCDFYHLSIDSGRSLLRTGNLTTEDLDGRGFLSYPMQTLLNFASKPRGRAPSRGRPPNTKPVEIDPLEQEIPAANQFREKVEFITKIVGEWINNGGIGISAMDPKHRLRWLGGRQRVGVEPYRHAWATVGGAGGDQRRVAIFDPNRPGDIIEDMEA